MNYNYLKMCWNILMSNLIVDLEKLIFILKDLGDSVKKVL